jgi:polysaccharide export outer membrane protein
MLVSLLILQYFREKKIIKMNLFFSKRKLFFTILLLAICCASCVSNKKIAYFQFDEIEQQKVSNVYKTVFKPDDLLQITVVSDDVAAAKPFNLPSVAFSAATNLIIAQPQQLSYLIATEK